MRGQAASLAATLLARAERVRRPATPEGALVVLAFHRVPSAEVAADELRLLRQVGQPVSLSQVLAADAGAEPLPPRPILVTLDDGHHSVIDCAPVFADLGVPAVCFVVADLIDSDEPFWWDEVVALGRKGARHHGDGPASGMDLVNHLKGRPDPERRAVLDELRGQVDEPVVARQMTRADLHALEDAGIEVGGHSSSHPILVQCDDEALAREVSGCRTRLTELMGTPPRSFAYPSGRVDDRVVDAVRAAGWEVAFAWDHAVARVPFPDRHRISRVHCSLGSGRLHLAQMASGRHRSLAATS